MSSESFCRVCKKPSRLTCGSCRDVSYCSKSHQREDWKNHKPRCLSFKVVNNDTFGRHLIATRKISEGELIIQEAPLVTGPAQVTPPVCLGCLSLLSEITARDCSVCGWPVCSETCAKSLAHRPECEITSRRKNGKVKISTFDRNFPHPSYQCLTVLRCLYLKKASPESWKKLMDLKSHCRERASTPKYNVDLRFIAEFIPKFFNFTDFSKEEILKVAGILQVNAHEVPLREPDYVGVYDKASFLEHNCRANCMKSFTSRGELVIRAAEKISPGDHLSICYTDPLWGREMRLNHLLETKFFRCVCARCSDPTEFGTHFDSLICPNRRCQTPLLNEKCEGCGTTAKVTLSVFEDATAVDKKSVKSCRDFLEKYKNILHPNHHFLVPVKLALLDLFSWPGPLLSLHDDDLVWTIKTCRELYELATKLVPAENRLRGLLLYHLQFALRESDRRKAMRTKVEGCQMRKNLLEIRKVLSDASKLLSYEPQEFPEGKMAVHAKKTLKELDEVLLTQGIEQ